MSKKPEPPNYLFTCPCGSGKLPQDCCFKNLRQQKGPLFPLPNQKSVLKEFSKYNQVELISAIAGLQIYPNNHSSMKRLAIAAQIACSIKNSGDQSINIFDLRQLFTDFFPAKGELSIRYEDPPEDLLTENIEFVNGNNIVYSGFHSDGGHILRTILRGLNFCDDELTEDFLQSKVIPQVLALLLLSNETAIRAGHSRYMISKVQLWGEIEIPDKTEFSRLQKAVIFSQEDIHSLFSPYGFDDTILDPFISHIGSSDLLKGYINDNPLFYRPLVKINDTILLTNPAAISGSIRHYILMMAKKERKIRQLTTAITHSYWFATQISLDLLGFKPVDVQLPELIKIEGFVEGIYAIDNDKIVYIQLIVDDANSYQKIYPLQFLSDRNRMHAINQRYDNVISWLNQHQDPLFRNIFFIAIFGSIGRSIHIKYSNEKKNVRALGLTSENLEVLARSNDCDCLKLWKFVGHFEEVSSFHQIKSFSILDKYEFYLKSHVPREVWQGDGEAVIIIPACSGQRLRIESAKKTDIHAVKSENSQGWVTVTRFSEDPSDPIFVPEGTFFHPFEHVIENYHQPIWVEARPVSGKIFKPNYSFYYQFIDVCSYWIWQVTESLRDHLGVLGDSPIHIGIDYENFFENGFINPNDNGEAFRAPSISIDNHARAIILTVNGTFFTAINKNDNFAERCLVDTLLRAFGMLLEKRNFPNTLDKATREQILENHIPYGKKRKLYQINTGSDASLDPRWLLNPRLLQDHDITEQLSGLHKELEEVLKNKNISPDKQDHITFFHDCVKIYLNRLKISISEYSWIELLSVIISRHEAFLHHLATVQHNVTSSIFLYSDLPTELQHVISRQELHDNTSLAMRNLLEIISAEPPHGNKVTVSITDFDTLLALSHHFTHLGIQADSVYYNLLISSPREFEDSDDDTTRNRVEKFFEGKYREGIEANLEDFNAIPSQEKQKEPVSESDFKLKWQQAFRAEFGLTQTQIIRFFACVVDLAFELESSSPHVPLSEFKAKVQLTLNWSDVDLNQAIKQFSLVPRPKYEISPEGYDADKDIFPWIYNRRISYLVRPLVIGPEPKDDPLIFWGPRHMHEALRILMDNIYTGRYLREDKISPEMRAMISRAQNESAKSFEKEVKEWFEKNTPWKIDHAVFISPEGKLRSDVNIGDIDVLAIDITSKKIYSIECKRFNFGRNPQEIAREIRKIIGNDGDTSSAMMKHLKRDSWLKDHLEDVRSTYNLPLGDYSIQSLFVVSEELATQYLREMPLPIIAFSRLRREGKEVFLNITIR